MLKLTIKPISIASLKEEFQLEVGSDLIVGEMAQLVLFQGLEGVEAE